MKVDMRRRSKLCCLAVVAAFSSMPRASQADEPCSTKIFFNKGETSERLPGVMRSGVRLYASVRVTGKNDDLKFLFDTGAGRTVLNRAVASRLALKPTGESSIGGVGAGRVPVDLVKGASLLLGSVHVEGVDLNIVDIPEAEHIDGIIGYDILCSSVVTLDYEEPSIVLAAASAFQYHGSGDILPIQIRRRWPFVRGTLKVPGADAVTDDFLIDTGSDDAVNHPVIRQSKGPLREVNTGSGGFGKSQPGVVGANEWFRIGATTIPATTSVCCAASEEVSRQLGSGILSRFRITFDYSNRRMILEQYRDR